VLATGFTFFETANYIEAAFWWVVAGGFAVAALRASERQIIRDCWLRMVAFAAFGLSDIVEARTGAWYDPWWLLLWKAMCLAVIAWLFVGYVRRRRRWM